MLDWSYIFKVHVWGVFLLFESYPTFEASISVSSTSFAWPISEGRKECMRDYGYLFFFSWCDHPDVGIIADCSNAHKYDIYDIM